MRDHNQINPDTLEPIGERIARLRASQNWTQQDLADRLAISRVAVSHIEMNISTPSERTVALIAGIFKIAPHKLVQGTTYPGAKAERLPHVVCFYTQLDLELSLLENDLNWIKRINNRLDKKVVCSELYRHWTYRLDQLSMEAIDERDQDRLWKAKSRLRSICSVD